MSKFCIPDRRFWAINGLVAALACPVSISLANPNAKVATFTYAGRDFPAELSLKHLFRDEVPRQTTGNCHIYAATALVEALCYQNANLRLDLSEAYFYNLHLQSTFRNQSSLQAFSKNIFANIQGGHAWRTLEQARQNNMLLEAQYPWVNADWKNLEKEANDIFYLFETIYEKNPPEREVSESLKGRAQEIKEALRDLQQRVERHTKTSKLADDNFRIAEAQKSELEKYSVEIAHKLRISADKKLEIARENLKRKVENLVGTNSSSSVPLLLRKEIEKHLGKEEIIYDSPASPRVKNLPGGLEKCFLPTTEAHYAEAYSLGKVLILLNLGIPVLCEGTLAYGSSEGIHSWILAGYNFNAQTQKLEFLMRDSNTGWAWVSPGCVQISYFTDPKALKMKLKKLEQE